MRPPRSPPRPFALHAEERRLEPHVVRPVLLPRLAVEPPGANVPMRQRERVYVAHRCCCASGCPRRRVAGNDLRASGNSLAGGDCRCRVMTSVGTPTGSGRGLLRAPCDPSLSVVGLQPAQADQVLGVTTTMTTKHKYGNARVRSAVNEVRVATSANGRTGTLANERLRIRKPLLYPLSYEGSPAKTPLTAAA